MNESIILFLKKQTCASICCVDDLLKPWCFSCFYAFNSEAGLIYFKSPENSQHSRLMKKNPLVAGTVVPDKLNKLVVKGIQFEGEVLATQHSKAENASLFYHTKHPMAMAIPGEIWAIQINHIKMTDSTLGFGKKIRWDRINQSI